MRRLAYLAAAGMVGWSAPGSRASAAEDAASARYADDVRPILEQYCYGCHGLGAKKGGVALDRFPDESAALNAPKLWHAVLKNRPVRASCPRPTSRSRRPRIAGCWRTGSSTGRSGSIRTDPDPGRVTVRRLNRVEYRNTIRDLIGVDYDTTAEFPPDDTGHGFDNIGDVLTLSPLLLEKYLERGQRDHRPGRADGPEGRRGAGDPGRELPARRRRKTVEAGPGILSYYEPSTVSTTIDVEHDGRYRLILDLTANERFVDGVNDYNRCRLLFRADGGELLRREFVRQDNKPFHFEFDRDWKAGPHTLTIEVQPLTPDEKRVRSLSFRIQSVTLRGPMDERYWVRPTGYDRFFPGDVPRGCRAGAGSMRGESSATSPSSAFRHPVDDATKDRLAALAEAVWSREGQTFEAGVAQAMAAVLTSPRFLFREEAAEAGSTGRYPLIDEYDLASRLSYFLWSSMPDAELFRLAGEHRLRANLQAQVDRMLADPRSAEFFRNFVGQWLQARDIETVIINAAAVMSRDEVPDPEAEKRRARFRELDPQAARGTQRGREGGAASRPAASFFGSFRRFREFELTRDLRRAMRRETEMLFEHIVREDRTLLELLDCDYTFLNERLAKYYGIDGVRGDQMRRVTLPAGSPRGGILTQGTVLAVTSNPDRTSPVKRGPVHPRQHPGLAAGTAAAEHPAAGGVRQEGRRPDSDPAGVAGPAPQRRVVRLVPRPDGPAGAGPRELQRARAMARQGAGRARRRLRAS